MKVILTFETNILDESVGTKNDALLLAVSVLEDELKEANSTDDLGDVFSIQIEEES